MPNVAGVTVSITAETARFVAGLAKGKREANRFARDVKRALVPLAAIGTTVGLLGRRVIQSTSELGKFSKIVGLSAEAVQELRFAAGQLDIEQRGIDDSLRRFNRRLGEFINSGGGPAAKALKDLGINTRDASGFLRGTEPVLNDVIDAIANIDSAARQGAIAAQLFGDDFGPKLVPLLQQGTRGIENLRAQARDLGLVLSTDLVEGAENANDKIGVLSNVIAAQFTKAVVDSADAWASLAEGLTSVLTAAAKFTADTGRGIGIFLAQIGLGGSDPTNPLFDARAMRQQLQSAQDELASLNVNQIGQFGAFANPAAAPDSERRQRLRNEIRALEAGLAALANPPRNDRGVIGGGQPDKAKKTVETIVGTDQEIKNAVNELTPRLQKIFGDAFNAELFSGKDSDLADPGALIGEIDPEPLFEPIKREATITERFIAGTLVDGFFQGWEDGLRGLLASWVRTIGRMILEAQALKAVQFLSGFFGTIGGGRPAGGRQFGGLVTAGQSVLAGERGPELVTAGAGPLRVTPLTGGGGVTINSPIDARGSNSEVLRRMPQILNERDDALEARILERLRGVG